MDKYDIKKQFKDLYAPRARDFGVVTVPLLNCLMLDGQGNPGTAPAYAAAIEALYSGSYAVKFASKHAERDYVAGARVLLLARPRIHWLGSAVWLN